MGLKHGPARASGSVFFPLTDRRWSPWGPAILLAAALAVLLLTASPGVAADATEEASSPVANDLPADGEKVRCPDCNEDGKVTCPACKGDGEITRACSTCKGSGQKPCPICAKHAKEGGGERGRLPCDYCGGRGVVGEAGRACHRCGGSQTLVCTTCFGKGEVYCKKRVYEKVCPTCRFVGKVTCTTCEGTTVVAPALLETRSLLKQRREAAAAERAGSQSRMPAAAARDEMEDEVRKPPATAEVQARYAKLTETYGAHFEIFAMDLTTKLETLRREVHEVQKKLRAERAMDARAVEEVEALMDRLQSFRRRWTELREAFLEEHRSYLRARDLWSSREEKLGEMRGRLRDEIEEQENGRMDILLRISERRADKLAEDEPAWIPNELAAIEAGWPPLKVNAEGLLAKAAEVAQAEAKAKEAEKTKRLAQRELERKKQIRPARPSSRPARTGAPAAGMADQTPDQEPQSEQVQDPSDSSLDAGSAALVRGNGKPPRREQSDKAAGAAPASSPTLPASLVWALLGFAAAGGLFWLVTRANGRQAPVPDEDAPPAVS